MKGETLSVDLTGPGTFYPGTLFGPEKEDTMHSEGEINLSEGEINDIRIG